MHIELLFYVTENLTLFSTLPLYMTTTYYFDYMLVI